MIEQILAYNKRFVAVKGYEPFITSGQPDMKLAIVSCMDTRLTKLLPNALGLTYRKNVATISNNFNVLPIKKRIKMMNKKKTNNSMRVKYVLYVPMIVMLLIVSNIDSIARSVTNVAVDNKVAPVSVLQKQKSPDNDQKVYTVAEEMPRFDGNLYQWLAQNIKYPAEASQRHEQGTVIIRFVVAGDGRVRQAEIIRGVSSSLDKEAMRIVSVMPKWIPGKQDGSPVAVYYTLPIRFKLSK